MYRINAGDNFLSKHFEVRQNTTLHACPVFNSLVGVRKRCKTRYLFCLTAGHFQRGISRYSCDVRTSKDWKGV